MQQQFFNPVDFGFEWTACEGFELGWFKFPYEEAIKAARAARDAVAKELKAEGHTVRKVSLGRQLVTRGGLGSGHPEITLEVPVYGIEWA